MGLAEMGTFDKTMEQEMDKKFKGLKLKPAVDDAASKSLTHDQLAKMHQKSIESLWPPDLVKLPLHEAVETAQKAKKDKELFDKMNEVTAKVASQSGYPYAGSWSSTSLPYQYTVDYVSSKPEEDNVEIEMSGFNKVGGMAQATVTIKGPTMGTEAKQQVAVMIADKVASGVADYVIKEHLQEIVTMIDFKAVSNLVLSKVLLSSGLADKELISMLLTPNLVISNGEVSLEMAAQEFLENGPGKSWALGGAGHVHLAQFIAWAGKMTKAKSTKK